MDIQTFFCRLSAELLVGLCLLLMIVPATAQDEPPPPQFLYRDENHLVLINGYTGETTEFSFEVTASDYFAWSPDGQYLLARLKDEETNASCLNLYDVDTLAWVSNEPISCGVWDAIFSADGTRIVYTVNGKTNGSLWLYSLADKISQELYRTTEGDGLNDVGISDIQWSPTETYLTFVSYRSLMAGTLNTMVVMDVKTQHHFNVNGGNTYFASYYPIWSADDRWFLIRLQGEYVTSFAVQETNHKGDVYLVNSETGEQYRLTYTPAVYESIYWTDDGRIAYAVSIPQETTLTLEQAKRVEVVPPEDIVEPEPVDIEAYQEARNSGNNIVSPDNNIRAWVSFDPTQPEALTNVLNIGDILSESRTVNFTAPIPKSYQYSNILIGWRPSDYPYPQG